MIPNMMVANPMQNVFAQRAGLQPPMLPAGGAPGAVTPGAPPAIAAEGAGMVPPMQRPPMVANPMQGGFGFRPGMSMPGATPPAMPGGMPMPGGRPMMAGGPMQNIMRQRMMGTA
jgi:hypothetical protein